MERIFHEFADDLAHRVVRLEPSTVLELAVGTGIVTRRLRDLLPDDCALTATDLNPPMLKMAMSKFQEGEDVCFEPADATQLPYSSSKFDTAVCQFGVMFFLGKQASYEEVLRVLKPGGHYVFNVWGAWDHNPFAEIVHDAVAEFFPDNPPGFYKVPFSYHDENFIVESVASAGFSQVKIEPLKITSDIPSATDFATGLVFGNPLFEEVTSRGGDPNKVCSAVSDAIKHKLGDSMPLQALLIVADKA